MREISITEQDIRCIEDFDIINDAINITYELWFEVDKYFGTHTQETDGWINFYTEYDKNGHISAEYCVCGGTEDECHEWELTEEEKVFFKEKMESYCQTLHGCSLDELFAEYAE